MKLEQQVVSLELAKRLKELGVKQESLFYWNFVGYSEITPNNCRNCVGKAECTCDRAPSGYEWIISSSRPDFGEDREIEQTTEGFSAFTVAELGEMLKSGMSNGHMQFDRRWVCEYEPVTGDGEIKTIKGYGNTEADSRAQLLIFLLEKNFITLP
jgi:hypothetical protein